MIQMIMSVSPHIGYGSHALQLCEALAKKLEPKDLRILGLESRQVPPEFGTLSPYVMQSHLELDAKQPVVILNVPDCVAQWPGRPRIGYTVWETSQIPAPLVKPLMGCDLLLTTCEFTKQVMENYGLEVDVVPEGVRGDIFRYDVVPNSALGKAARRTMSTVVFMSGGKFEKRKGHDLVLEAWKRAFGPQDDVSLVLDWDNVFMQGLDVKKVVSDAGLGDDKRIVVVHKGNKAITRAERAALYACVDVCLAPSRGESWNLILIEMAAMGRWPVWSDCTAHRDYMDWGRGISCAKTSEAKDGFFFKEGCGRWYEPDLGELVYAMQEAAAADKRPSTPEFPYWMRCKVNGESLAKNWSWDEAARKFLELMAKKGVM